MGWSRSTWWTGALICLAWVTLNGNSHARGQGVDYVKEHYTKYEYKIPMRDGVKLFTSVYVPKDHSRTYPILLTRTPYSVRPYGVDQYRGDLGPSPRFARAGYVFVYQDVRGRWMSEGDFEHVRIAQSETHSPGKYDDQSDAWDTMDWLVKHLPHHNGRVGVWGISYPGYYTTASLINAHPALKAASPQAPVTDWFAGDDWHHNGAFFLNHAFNFMWRFGRPRPEPTTKFDFEIDHGTPDGYEYFLRLGTVDAIDREIFKGDVAFWNELLKHGDYDAYWKARNVRPYLKKIKPAVLTVGGWFDAENLFGALETYKAIETQSPDTKNALVMGPWIHGGWAREQGASLGSVRFNAETSAYYQEKIEFPFFEHHLKGSGEDALPEARIFMTGKNEWVEFDHWPPRKATPRSLVLGEEGHLSLGPAGEASGRKDRDAADHFVSDPNRPVPYFEAIANGMRKEYMVADQRFAARRPDVLTYTSDVLEEDVTIVGPIEVKLHVATTGTDADWVVKLIDVYPNDFADLEKAPAGERMGGYQQLVRGDVMRGKFRNHLDKPEPFVPGQPTSVRFRLPDTAHSFRSGHRIMVQIQSSWFPLVDRNPQTFTDIYSAKESEFQQATHTIHRSDEFPSSLEVLVLP